MRFACDSCKLAHKQIQCNKIPLNELQFLLKSANNDCTESQYLLGNLLLQILDSAVDLDENIRQIRRKARKKYETYLTERDSPPSERISRPNRSAKPIKALSLQKILDPSLHLQDNTENWKFEELSYTYSEAAYWIRRAANATHSKARTRLGNLCLSQDPPLVEFALRWYFSVIEEKKGLDKVIAADALYNIGMLLYDGVKESQPPLSQNRGKAMQYFFKAAEYGDPCAQYFVGTQLFHGQVDDGIQMDSKSGLILIERAASDGHTGAMYFLAQLYRSGDDAKSIRKDECAFRRYLEQAIEGHDPDALFCVADMHFHGTDGTPRDLSKAVEFYSKAGIAGNSDAYCCLGAMHYNGIGTAQDHEQAFKYYQLAAEQDSMEAWKNLAEMHYLGRGVPKNPALGDSILKMLSKQEEI